MNRIDTSGLAQEMEDLHSLPAHNQRYKELKLLASQIGDDRWGDSIMIPADEFEDYAHEMAADTGSVPVTGEWPHTHINWTTAAAELEQDCKKVDWEGSRYFVY